MGYEKRLMSFWKKKKTNGIKDQERSGTKKVIEIPSTSTTKHLKEKRKMRLVEYGTRVRNGVKIWEALQA